MEDVVDAEKHVTPAAKSMEAGCPICLEKFKDKAYVDVCFHTFCFACILQWADVVSSCPMCKTPFKSIIHNVRGVDDYDQHEIRTKPVLISQEVSLAEARRFWYRTTQLTSTRKGQRSPSKRSTPRGRDIAAQKRRKAIYAANLWVKPLPAEDGVKKIRLTNAQFYKSNPAAAHRLVPWMTREFKVILGEANTSFMVALVNSMLNKHDITSPEFAQQLRPFLFEQTNHFIHEFVSFARSPYDMVAYDDKAEYDVPPDGTSLPELPGIDSEAGPSQQGALEVLLGADNNRHGSPTMKQCRGDDDTSPGSDDHHDDSEDRHKKSSSSHSRANSKNCSRAHSRDSDRRMYHRDDSPHSRKRRGDHYDHRDRHDSRGYKSSHDHHRHHHRHGYSSSSSTERHSHRRKRQRSVTPDKSRSSHQRKGRKESKSSKSDRRRSATSPSKRKRKHRRHRHGSSDSNSSAEHRHGNNKKLEVADGLHETSDEVLQEQLLNLESQINMDKKMLLKNLLRKERLALLHDSLEKEQNNEELLVVSDDNKLKEELEQLDDAIATGKDALIKVMKRIGSTESDRNTSEL